jgi:hypothetical protein
VESFSPTGRSVAYKVINELPVVSTDEYTISKISADTHILDVFDYFHSRNVVFPDDIAKHDREGKRFIHSFSPINVHFSLNQSPCVS